MKRIYLILIGLFVLSAAFGLHFQTSAQNDGAKTAKIEMISPNIVISQFQVTGGAAELSNDEFIELHNTGSSNFDLNGFRLVYRSATGSNDIALVNWATTTIIPPGGYYLVASTSYDGLVTPNITYSPTACQCSMAAAGGGIAIRNGALNTGIIFDSVGYGSAVNAFVEGTATAAPPANASQTRLNNGCQETDNNAADFSTINPSGPRNTSSNANLCGGGGGTTLLAGGGASPNTLAPGGSTLLTVSVFPATNPPSTGITVTANLTSIGGSANQQFFDDGTNGDVTPGDNTFSFFATIPAGMGGGTYNIVATAVDQQMRSVNVSINITVNAAPANDNPLLLGIPGNATADVANENNYLMIKPQYSLSYNRSRATANWVAWRLDSSWIGSAPRQDDFRPDTTLPANWYQVTDSDYSGSGYDRGHMTPSGDRTRSIPDNSATFLMTNIVPQLGANNQGPWNDFENYCRTLAQAGNEIYIFSGVAGNIGTIAQGRIVIPQYTWKVVLVLPNGDNDLGRITQATRTIGIIVPNFPPLNSSAPWRNFRVSVDAVEQLAGINFYKKIPRKTQVLIEQRVDNQ